MALKVSGGTVEAGPVSNERYVDVRDRYQIDSEKPLPQFDSQPAVAYHCVHKRDTKRSLFALICDPKLPPRLDVVGIVRRTDHRNVLRALDWDVVDWAPEGRRCPIVIIEKPGGTRVFPSIEGHYSPMPEEWVTRNFIDPACQVLRDLHSLGTYHRMIRPDNLFWMDESHREMVVGECFSAPAGVTNPIVYETLECALSSAAGRGEGGPENDLYAVGVTILALLTGQSPLAGQEDEAILRSRLSHGSYAALVQHHRVSLTMMEPLRGLLNDDPSERWTLEDLTLWVNGRRLSPKQQVMPTKGSRGLTIAGRDYNTAREVANAMHRNWDQAAVLVSSGALDNWLRRSLGEDDRVEAVNLAKAGAGDHSDKLIARILIALDPDGPIRLKEFSATVEGVSTLLGAFANDSAARQLFASVISMGLIHFWMEQQRGVGLGFIRHMSRLDKVRAMVNQTALGAGIERVVYELNPGLPCQSPLFERDFVPLVEMLMPAFERLCYQEDPPKNLIDRHVAAFLATNFKRPLGGEFRDVDKGESEQEGRIAQTRILAALQDAQHRDAVFPKLCEFTAMLLDPAVDRFASRERRKKIRARLRKAAKSGRIQDLLEIIDDMEELAIDKQSFESASREYHVATFNLINLTKDIHHKPELAIEIGGQLSGAVAMLGCVMTVALAGIFAFL